MKGKARSWFFRLAAFAAGLLILVLLVYYAGPGKFLDIILGASPYWLCASVAVYAASWIFRTWRLRLFTRHAGARVGAFALFRLHISGYALNTLLPAKLGDVATMGYLRSKGIETGRSVAIVVQTRMLDALALIVLAVPGITLFLQSGAPDWVTTALVACAALVAVPVGFVALDRKKRVSGLLRRLGSRTKRKPLKFVLEKAGFAYESYHTIMRDGRLFAGSALLSMIIWLLDVLTCYAVTLALGAQIPFVVVMLAVAIANVGKSAPATPGSIGIYETILASVLALFAVPFDMAVALAIADHMIKNLFTLVIGVPAAVASGQDLADLRKAYQKRG